MRILAIGDITSPAAQEYLCQKLWKIREEYSVDFCIVNAENASFINGASAEQAERLLLSGADVITGGNHTMQNYTYQKKMEECKNLLRPINYTDAAPGRGYTIADGDGMRVLVINAMGTVHIEPPLDSPYGFIERALLRERGNFDIAVLDIHAEATGEKLALAYEFDGRINVIFGTHTHVPTADGRILPGGTGYITDLGMCGESEGVLGMEPASVIYRMKTHMPGRFKAASGKVVADGVIFDIDGSFKRVVNIERIQF